MARSFGWGFTLIEVLVALAMLASVGALVLTAQGVSNRHLRLAMERETAYWLARSRLIEASAHPDHPLPEDSRVETYENVDYLTLIEVRELSPLRDERAGDLPAGARLTEVRVRVSWGAGRELQLTRLLRGGLRASPPGTSGSAEERR